jgi:hypothetical protein
MSIQPGATVSQDPSAKKFYTFDWTDWLESGVEIDDYTLSVSEFTGDPSPLVVAEDTIVNGEGGATNAGVTLQLSGGKLGKVYTVTCHIVTNEAAAQEDDRSFKVRIAQL